MSLFFFHLNNVGDEVSLPKEHMKELHEVMTSSFFKSVKEVRTYVLVIPLSSMGPSQSFYLCLLLCNINVVAKWGAKPRTCCNVHV